MQRASAQTAPEFLVSWRAHSLVPASYAGKIFPTKNSPIDVGVDIVDGTAIADISGKEIIWSSDNALDESGIGKKNVQFKASATPGTDQIIRITVKNYKGRDVETVVVIPVAAPEAVIEQQNPQGRIGSNAFRAVPYFFSAGSVQNLNFEWRVDNRPLEAKSDAIDLDLSSQGGTSDALINLSVFINNLLNPLEFAKRLLSIQVKK